MNNINGIRKRINSSHKHHRLYVVIISALLLASITLATLIYGKSNTDAKIFGIPLADINKRFDNFFGGLFQSNINTSTPDQTVSTSVKYTYLGNNYYECEDQSVPAIADGIVNTVALEDSGYYVLISYKNGVTAQYFELTEAFVKPNDNLKGSDTIGAYETKFKALFIKNNEVIKYENIFD